MNNLDFIVINENIINIRQISNIIYDESLCKYVIIMVNNNTITISPDDYKNLYQYLNRISNSFVIII